MGGSCNPSFGLHKSCVETIELSKDWRLERPDKDSVWYLVDLRDENKAVPFPALKVTKANREDKGKLLKQLLDMNELLAQTDIIRQVFPPPRG
jgi:hypothetical protein